MFRIRREVANCRESHPGNDRIGDHVDVFVNLSRVKSAIEMNVAIARRELARYRLSELPLRPWDHRTWSLARIANCQHIARIFRRSNGILNPADVSGNKMPQR